MIQFAGAFFSENDLCTLEFSILVKMLHNIFGHNTDYEICLVFCFAACLTATILHERLAEGQVSGIMWSSEPTPRCSHKFVLVLRL